jgi:hypothetical protein
MTRVPLLKNDVAHPENVHREDPKDGLAKIGCLRKAVTVVAAVQSNKLEFISMMPLVALSSMFHYTSIKMF